MIAGDINEDGSVIMQMIYLINGYHQFGLTNIISEDINLIRM